jgi:phosphoribosyl-ATP pyrophosphohydrolase
MAENPPPSDSVSVSPPASPLASPSAFSPEVLAPDATILEKLHETVLSRRGGDPEASYTARLFARGPKKIAQKVGEEAVEAVIEIIRGDADRLADESADILYHLVVAWAEVGVQPTDVWRKLAERRGVSGIEEKKSRKKDKA